MENFTRELLFIILTVSACIWLYFKEKNHLVRTHIIWFGSLILVVVSVNIFVNLFNVPGLAILGLTAFVGALLIYVKICINLLDKVFFLLYYNFVMMKDDLLTIDDLSHYLKVKPRTIYDWLLRKKIPAIKIVGQWRFRKDSIDSWLKKMESKYK